MISIGFLWKCYLAYRGNPQAALEVAQIVKKRAGL